MTTVNHKKLTRDTVHLWQIKLNEPEDVINKWVPFLSQDEVDRAQRFHFQKDRTHFIAAHANMRLILSEYLQQKPNDIVFSFTGDNKPFIKNTSFQFNLSHAHHIALLAITTHDAVGVDIEYKKNRDYRSLAKRFFSREENCVIETLSDEQAVDAFYRIWTKKEAVLKANGQGLNLPLDSFSVSIDESTNKVDIENEHWYISTLDVPDNYVAALATATKTPELIRF